MPRPFEQDVLRFKDKIIRAAQLHSVRGEEELKWVSRQPFLQSKGYVLRARYHPDWVPSWTLPGNEDMDPRSFEDYIRYASTPAVIDATRQVDGRLVCIKGINTTLNNTREVEIALMFSDDSLRGNPRNHCVPILDVFQDETNPAISYIVMPYLRPIEDPPFETVADVIDFVGQMLVGLIFMHEQGVAHRDCADTNIMMDADVLFPEGFHPISRNRDSTAQRMVRHLSRKTAAVKYYYTDFGYSSYWPPHYEGSRLVTGMFGRDKSAPELSDDIPYDPFKLDIRVLGTALRELTTDLYQNIEFLDPLIESMTRDNPSERPNAREAERMWRDILATKVSYLQHMWRLRPVGETWTVSVVEGGANLVDSAYRMGRSVFGWLSDLSG